MKKTILVLSFFIHLIGYSQNSSFLLNQALPQYNNPAQTGIAPMGRLVYGFSGQNLSLAGRSLENYLAYDRHVKSLSGGVGIEFYNRNFAKRGIVTSSLSVNYAYQYAVTHKLTFSAGAGFTFKHQKTDIDKLTGGAVISDEAIFRVNFLDYKLGAVLYNDVFYVQIDLGRFGYGGTFDSEKYGQNTIGFGIGHKITLFKNPNYSILPSINYFYSDGFQAANVKTVVQIKDLYLGAGFQVGSYFSLMGGYNFGPFRVKLATAINSNKLTNSVTQQFDLVLQFNFANFSAKTFHGLVLQSNKPKTIPRLSNAFKLNLF